MKYWQYTVVFQEMPNDIALAFELTNCPYNCDGCHSPHLRQDIGEELTFDGFVKVIDKYYGLVTAVMFLGSAYTEDDKSKLITMLEYCKRKNLKTCIWTGQNEVCGDIKKYLDFLKTGQYIKELGDLKSKITNQRYIDLKTNRNVFGDRVYV